MFLERNFENYNDKINLVFEGIKVNLTKVFTEKQNLKFKVNEDTNLTSGHIKEMQMKKL